MAYYSVTKLLSFIITFHVISDEIFIFIKKIIMYSFFCQYITTYKLYNLTICAFFNTFKCEKIIKSILHNCPPLLSQHFLFQDYHPFESKSQMQTQSCRGSENEPLAQEFGTVHQ